jgi:uroporphyrinogen-III synthase
MNRDLNGRTILITRPREQAEELVSEIERRGGTALVVPAIRIGEPVSWEKCDDAIRRFNLYDAIAFTSRNAVGPFLDRCRKLGLAVSRLEALEVYAVGSETARRLEDAGVAGAIFPDTASAEGLGALLASRRIEGRRFLIPGGNRSRPELRDTIVRLGATADCVEVYRTEILRENLPQEVIRRLDESEVDAVAFASPSAVTGFFHDPRVRQLFRQTKHPAVAVIGQTTAEAVRYLGLSADIVAGTASGAGLAGAIAALLGNKRNGE